MQSVHRQQGYIMDRQEFNRVVAAAARVTGESHERIARGLVDSGIAPETAPRSSYFNEACRVFGAQDDLRDHETICQEHGWADPAGIQHVAVAVTKQRRFVVLQAEEDGQPLVQVYVYDLIDPGTFWTIEPPTVVASS